LLEAIDARTAVVVLSNVHWSDGTVFDVAAVQPDLLVCAGYKWLMGAYGLSIAYVGPRFDGGEPIETVWTSQVGSEEFSRLAEYRDALREDASRYDGGQRANLVHTSMLCAALDQLLAWGVANIQAYCHSVCAPVLARWEDRLADAGIVVEDTLYRAQHLFGMRLERVQDPHAIALGLAAHGVSVSIRGNAVRVSPHVYNDAEDVDALIVALLSHCGREPVRPPRPFA
jgi:selenocysteine lyase/cysteine desulfurase